MINSIVRVINDRCAFSILVKLPFLVQMAVVDRKVSSLVVKTLDVLNVVELRFKSILTRPYLKYIIGKNYNEVIEKDLPGEIFLLSIEIFRWD